jgi:hypothetical protein
MYGLDFIRTWRAVRASRVIFHGLQKEGLQKEGLEVVKTSI